jgi:hypothetical protein
VSAEAEMRAVLSALDELLGRVAGISAGLDEPEREALGHELAEVERTLGTARRRLARVLEHR